MNPPADGAALRWAEAGELLGWAGRGPSAVLTWLGAAWSGPAALAYEDWASVFEQATRRSSATLADAAACARAPAAIRAPVDFGVLADARDRLEARLHAVQRALRHLDAVRIPGQPLTPPRIPHPRPPTDSPPPRADPATTREHLSHRQGGPVVAAPHRSSTGGVHGWVAEAVRVLRAQGYRDDQINPEHIATIISHESAGNPSAINNADSNADRGTPSMGIMQTIRPTFERWALPGHRRILDPVDNIIAGCRYAIDRYGSVSRTPGILSLQAGGAYRGY